MDFRRKVITALKQGHPVSTVAKRFEINAKKQYRLTAVLSSSGNSSMAGSAANYPRKCPMRSSIFLRDALDVNPNWILLELSQKLSTPVVQSAVHRALR